MKATLEQLAWYIERDEIRCTRYHASGGRTYSGDGFTVDVPSTMIDELDAKRDRVAALLHSRRALAREEGDTDA